VGSSGGRTNTNAYRYEGQVNLPTRPLYTNFSHASREYNSRGAEDYWLNLLNGSSMTNIVSHKAPPHQHGKTRTITREVDAPRQSENNMTFANVLMAAWALVFAVASSSTNVVFGHLISGRNMQLDNGDINEVLGPCINMVPVRVRLGSAPTGNDVLQQVYNQQLSCIPFETLGLDQIIERCTDWPLWTRFSSVVQHQNLDGLEDIICNRFRFGEAVCRSGGLQRQQDSLDILVVSASVVGSPERIAVNMVYNEKLLAPDFVSDMMDLLLTNIELLTSPTAATSSLSELSRTWTQAPPQIPLLARDYVEKGLAVDQRA
jgi:non-ribosomal peptide synthetase component F